MKYYPMFDLFDDFFTGNTTSDVMKTDIVEKDGNYEMSMELPGVKKGRYPDGIERWIFESNCYT